MSLVPWYAGIGVAQAAVGLWVILAHPRRLLNWAVGAWLILWAGSGVFFQLMREATDAASYEFYSRVGSAYETPTFLFVLLIVDRALLSGPVPRWRNALLAGASAVLAMLFAWLIFGPRAVAVPVVGGGFTWSPDGAALFVGTVAFHGAVASMLIAVALASRAADAAGRTPLERRQAALVGLAFAILVAQPAGGAMMRQLAAPFTFSPGVAPPAEVLWLFALAPLAYALVALPRPFERASRLAVRAAILGSFVAGAVTLPFPLAFGPYGARVIVVTAFALTLAVAVLRYDLAAPDTARHARRQRAAAFVLAFATTALIAGAVVSATGSAPLPLALAATAAVAAPVALLAVPTGKATAWLARRVLLDPRDPDVLRGRVRAYERALHATRGPDGHIPPAAWPNLATLRQELGLSQRDHELILALGDVRASRPLVTYRIALESASVAGSGEDALELRELREALGIAPQEHELALRDLRGTSLAEGGLFLERYRIVRRLGHGGFGEVWLARDGKEGRDVVLKRLLRADARDARAMRRAAREVDAARALAHPRIVTVFDVATRGDEEYLVMEHLSGGSLADEMCARGPLTEDVAVRVARDVLAALGALHARGIVHRDVKPANILLDAEGRAKLGDFTIARELVSGDTVGPEGARGPIGTFAYMPPEQARGLAARPQSDLYALAATLYEAVSGAPPLAVDGLSHAEAARKITSELPTFPVPGASPRLSAAIERGLSKRAEDRFVDADEMASALA